MTRLARCSAWLPPVCLPPFARRPHCRCRLGLRRYYQDVVRQMSPGLRGEFSSFEHKGLLDSIPFLTVDYSGMDAEAIGKALQVRDRLAMLLAERFVNRAYPPMEAIVSLGEMNTYMYVVRRGLVGMNGKVLSKDHIFGEDVVVKARLKMRRDYTCISLTFVDLMVLQQTDLFRVLQKGNFAVQRRKVRVAATKLLILRGMKSLAYAHKVLAAEARLQQTALAHSSAARLSAEEQDQLGFKGGSAHPLVGAASNFAASTVACTEVRARRTSA